jgi:hypothetical protein
VYVVRSSDEVDEQIAQLPHDGAARFAELRAALELDPWSGDPYVVVIVVKVVLPGFVVQTTSTLPEYTGDFSAACERAGTAFSSATDYTGPGPHPVEVFAVDPDNQSTPNAWTDLGGLETSRPSNDWDPVQPENVQLVACANRTSVGDVVRTCPYSDLSIPSGDDGPAVTLSLHAARYHVDVYTAQTHSTVASFDLDGDTTCPTSQMLPIGTRSGIISARPAPAQLRHELTGTLNG